MIPQLLDLTRRRRREQKLRIGIELSALATVKIAIGYDTRLPEPERKAMADSAKKIIKAARGKLAADDLDAAGQVALDQIGAIVSAHYECAKMHDSRISEFENGIASLLKQSPIAEWIQSEPQRGLGLNNVASIIGETGDLRLYDAPAKVWKRMGCYPFKGRAPSTWRREGGLSPTEWTEAGYSPQRRSIAFTVAECLIKGNQIREKGPDGKTFDGARVLWCGPYRARYDDAKLRAAESHPDWTKAHIHAHAHLLCAKRLLRELWRAWNGIPEDKAS